MLVLFLTLILSDSILAQRTYSVITTANTNGGDVVTNGYKVIGDVAYCQSQCDSYSGCFAFFRGSGNNGCWLKTGQGSFIADAGDFYYINGTLGSPPTLSLNLVASTAPPLIPELFTDPTGNWIRYPNITTQGSTLKTLNSVTRLQCMQSFGPNSSYTNFVMDVAAQKCEVRSSLTGFTGNQLQDLFIKTNLTAIISPRPYVVAKGWHYPITMQSPVLSPANASNCIAVCDYTPGCIGFAVDNATSVNKCYLKSVLPKLRQLSASTIDTYFIMTANPPVPIFANTASFKLISSSKRNYFAYYNMVPYPSGLVSNFTGSGYDEAGCMILCDQTPGCIGFQAKENNNGFCMTFSNITSIYLSTNAGSDLYFVTTANVIQPRRNYTTYTNFRIGTLGNGLDLLKIATITLEDCQARCDNIVGCQGAEYDTGGNTCNLKADFPDPSTFLTANNWNVYIIPKKPIVSRSYVFQPNTDYSYRNLRYLYNFNASACAFECDRLKSCAGYVYEKNSKNCALKSAVLASMSSNDTTKDAYFANTKPLAAWKNCR